MRYFTYMAEQSFKADEQGQRLFYLGGPWSRPYLIDNAETEKQLFWKLTWHYRVFLTVFLLTGPLYYRHLIPRPLWFFGWLVGLVAIQWVVLRLLFFKDLRRLQRVPARVSFRTFYIDAARKHTRKALLAGVIGGLAAVVTCTIAAFTIPDATYVYIGCAGIGLAITAGWAYMLRLKSALDESAKSTDSEIAAH